MTPALVWFRLDLRLRDNEALAAALGRGGPVVPFFCLDGAGEGAWAPGEASRHWLHHSLEALGGALASRGSRLVVLRGPSLPAIRGLVRATGAGAVYWNRRIEPAAAAGDAAVLAALQGAGVDARGFGGALLFEPGQVRNRQGEPFRVFTPFWRHCLSLPAPRPVALRSGPFPGPRRWPRSLDLGALGLPPRNSAGLSGGWRPGEAAAAALLRRFAAGPIGEYASRRDPPGGAGTSLLSPHLHFGEVSPRQVWAAVAALSRESGVFPANNGARAFLAELGWREFAHHLLFHFPRTPEAPFRAGFETFPWKVGPSARLTAWQRGATGYPVVDAGMRQLRESGWMHNRARMIAASFLVKDLGISWKEGARWFWKALVDADLANNTLGWQWSAGCGPDAAPFFRIFSPVRQGERLDPKGLYVRRWLPELSGMPDAWIHRPWEAPAGVLAEAGVTLGASYPRPVVDHASAREAALKAFGRMRNCRPS